MGPTASCPTPRTEQMWWSVLVKDTSTVIPWLDSNPHSVASAAGTRVERTNHYTMALPLDHSFPSLHNALPMHLLTPFSHPGLGTLDPVDKSHDLTGKKYWKKWSRYQENNEVPRIVSKPLVSCLWGCGVCKSSKIKHPGGFVQRDTGPNTHFQDFFTFVKSQPWNINNFTQMDWPYVFFL